jgi:hypothetical protein
MNEIDKTKVNPGFHRQFLMDRFDPQEKEILMRLSKEWYLTNSGKSIKLAASHYNYFLMKPTQSFSEMFNIDREVNYYRLKAVAWNEAA